MSYRKARPAPPALRCRAVATPALDVGRTLLDDVDFLWSKHPKAVEPGVGRPRSEEGPLNRACVALPYTAWEVYVEDSLSWLAQQAAAA